jgi:hypothetical protein
MRTLIPVLLLTACASSSSPQQGGSRGPRASDHLAAADQHTQEAEQLARWPDRHASNALQPTDTGSWYRAWDTVSNELRLARHHRTAAAQLVAEYDEACGQRSLAEISVSPLQRYAVGGAPTEDGALLFLSVEAGTPDQLMAAMRCHRAWMMLGRTDMESCPLDLAGLRVQARGDSAGISVELGVRDRRLVPELQRRVAHDVEAAAQRRAAVAPR